MSPEAPAENCRSCHAWRMEVGEWCARCWRRTARAIALYELKEEACTRYVLFDNDAKRWRMKTLTNRWMKRLKRRLRSRLRGGPESYSYAASGESQS